MDRTGGPATKGLEPSDSGLDSGTHNSDFAFDWMQITQELIKVLENWNAWKTQSLTNDNLQQRDHLPGHFQPRELSRRKSAALRREATPWPSSCGHRVNRQGSSGRTRGGQAGRPPSQGKGVLVISVHCAVIPVHTCIGVNATPCDHSMLFSPLSFSKRELFIVAIFVFLHHHVSFVLGGRGLNMSFNHKFLDKGNISESPRGLIKAPVAEPYPQSFWFRWSGVPGWCGCCHCFVLFLIPQVILICSQHWEAEF